MYSSADLDILWNGSISYYVKSNCLMFKHEIATRMVSMQVTRLSAYQSTYATAATTVMLKQQLGVRFIIIIINGVF